MNQFITINGTKKIISIEKLVTNELKRLKKEEERLKKEEKTETIKIVFPPLTPEELKEFEEYKRLQELEQEKGGNY